MDRKALAAGIATMVVGAGIMAATSFNPSMMSEGVHWIIGAIAGFVFFLAGVLVVRQATRQGQAVQIVDSLLVAVLITAFAAVACIFPPSAVIVAALAVQAWVAVYRQIHAKIWGRDPLGHLSQEKQLGVGCLVYLLLLVIAAVIFWQVRSAPPPVPLSPEAPP